MHEYDISIFAGDDGAVALSIHAPESSGTSPVARFSSVAELTYFLESVDLDRVLVEGLERCAATVGPSCAYHERIFLPDACEEQLKSLSQSGWKSARVLAVHAA